MDVLNNVLEMIMGWINKIISWIDAIIIAFMEGQNKYIIYAVLLYIIGVFGTGKVRLNLDTRKK